MIEFVRIKRTIKKVKVDVIKSEKKTNKKNAPGEARTHNPGIAQQHCFISTVR